MESQRQHKKEGMGKSGRVGRIRSSWDWLAEDNLEVTHYYAQQASGHCTLRCLHDTQMAIGWPCSNLCIFEGKQKMARQGSERQQVKPCRLYSTVLSVTCRLMKSDIHGDLSGR